MSGPRPRILAIDDAPANLITLGAALGADYDLQVATSGAAGLLLAAESPPDLILLDVMMPEMDGYATCRRLKDDPRLCNVPVVFVSALGESDAEVAGLALGAADYIVKPINVEIARQRISNLLERESLRKALAALCDQLESRVAERTRELLQAEKLSSIGQIAAGVAHEINNPISFVLTNVGVLDDYVDQLLQLADLGAATPVGKELAEEFDFDFLRDDLGKLLAESRQGLERVRKIVADLKSFAHADQAEWQDADLLAGLDSTLNVVWHEFKYKVEIVRELAPLPSVRCIPAQINQVFMNLLVNAGQAIATRGVITLRSGCDDGQVWVEIGDSGCGIDEATRRRLFEPFFTTKPVGIGTGLGLSVTWDIVQRHAGAIEVDSAPGQGSRFRLRLPIAGAGTGTAETAQASAL